MLTERELAVLKLRKEGKTQAETAKILDVSQPAVSSFERNAQKKIKDSRELLETLKKLGLLALLLCFLPLLAQQVNAVTLGHNASQIAAGTFSSGNFTFPNSLTVNGSLLYVNSATGNVGIGTTSPGAKLEVVGDIISKGTQWTSRTSAADNKWYSVTYGNGLFVAVAYNGTGNRVMTSPDGVNWTSRTSAADIDWYSVTYGNGLFVAVGNNGSGTNDVMTSPDGITWTIRAGAADLGWRGVTYGNGTFVAVNWDTPATTDVMTSPDGVNWTTRTSSAGYGWIDVTYGNGQFVALSSSGVMTSPDGITWTNRTIPTGHIERSVTYGNGLYVAVGFFCSNDCVMTSPDGITWTRRTSSAGNVWFGVTYGDGLFVAVGNGATGYSVMTSPDGITWTSRTNVVANQWQDVTYGNGMFVAVSDNGAADRVLTSGKTESTITPNNNIYQGGMTINGNVGINTRNPREALSVNGNINASGSINSAAGIDLAESYAPRESVAAGDIVAAPEDNAAGDEIVKGTQANPHLIVGVVSTAPGMTLNKPGLTSIAQVAIAGRVPVKVTGVVEPGDFITISSTPGVGQRATEAGFVLGRALTENVNGTVIIIIQPTYFSPAVLSTGALLGGETGKNIFTDNSATAQAIKTGELKTIFEAAQTPSKDLTVDETIFNTENATVSGTLETDIITPEDGKDVVVIIG